MNSGSESRSVINSLHVASVFSSGECSSLDQDAEFESPGYSECAYGISSHPPVKGHQSQMWPLQLS